MIYFIGGLYPNEVYPDILKNSKKNVDNAANALQWSLLSGFKDCGSDVRIISVPNVSTFPRKYKKMTVKAFKFIWNDSVHDSLGFITLPLISLFSKFLSIRRKLSEILRTDDTIIVYSLRTPYLLAVTIMKKKVKNLHFCVVVPDLPQYMSSSKNLIYRILKKIDGFIIKFCIKKADSFVLLADAMAEHLKVGKRPWVRIEGIYQSMENTLANNKTDDFVFAYTGTLDARYGILDLIEAFKKLDKTNLRLWICGKGNTEDYIIKSAIEDNRIVYYGMLPREKVLSLQQRATILINPRKPIEEYVKFSFPSKTMEYLGSGTPCMMYKLPAMPNEYEEYIIAIPNKYNALYEKMLEISTMERQKLEKFGQRAKDFVQNKKNPKVQVAKIIQMLTCSSNHEMVKVE